ncbi:3-carboxy-cis,cis-muconate cycloisomerase [Noviherbaspirillum galbum]|uniref:3-carboxy-cis,cis-muconate cycloisomerase n=1 Tax=Noviherbaspirillum galbum TaxID=2709383 RepID=A0A6B3SME5_9BURK|nr:3-carboxy-cis,cis-muconate cycloisomerase [Noviherbaspirillum galbum]NEX62020.1 3-carboxy-cis,cis-muconate cycloisomerase [Noviherbaspirillum galbum]
MTSTPLSSLTGPMFSTDAMRAVFSAEACVQGMLDFEAALAHAEAACGVIPASAAEPIAARCRQEHLNLPALGRAAASAGNLAIPLVKQLTADVAAHDKEAAKYVHWGATSQDAIDTGLVLQLRQALDLIDQDLRRLGDALAALAQAHRDTTMIGRTWMQHALPATFGLKAAGWLDGVQRHQERFSALRARVLALQFGGAAGTLASLGGEGLRVAQALADRLQLALPAMPWHTQRDRIAEVAAIAGMLTGSLGKMARDVSLLMQTDVAEASEPAAQGRGGSSTMPHKRNPVACAAALTAAARVPGLVATVLSGMVQEHERALGGWQAEWDSLPEILQLTAGALAQMADTMAGLSVDAARMRANVDITHGLVMAEAVTLALGARMGRMEAHKLVEAACRRAVADGLDLKDALGREPALKDIIAAGDLDRLLDPAQYLGQAAAFTDRVLARQSSHAADNKER